MSELPAHRSVSQLNSYKRCPYSYYLGRIEKVWSRPAAWLAQGTAFHEAAELMKKREHEGNPMTLEEAKEAFQIAYDREINDAADITPNFDYWFASGPYNGELDIARRFNLGLTQVEAFKAWDESHPEEVIWIAPDGTPGIEIGFDIDLDGVLVRGFIDAVVEVGWAHNPGGELQIVRDYKTGNSPGDDFQLGVYGVALEMQYGLRVNAGDYWMGKTGKPTREYDVSLWTRERVTESFHELEANLKAGRFPALPEPDKCRFCDVAHACDFAGG